MSGNQIVFSSANRKKMLTKMAEQELDLIVIGGGITGCGIALDGALRGLKVAVLEMQDFASGTSSRSTKLIHGGLRYLKQGEVNLVREVGQERAILYKNAPHLVLPEPMLLPLVQGGTYGKLATSIGLWIYDRLAGVQREERRKMLTKQQTLKLEPLLKKNGLKGGGLYVEYRTDDARLTIEVVKTAVNKGALAVNHTKVHDFIYHGRKVQGVRVTDLIDDQEYEIFAKKIVNATGPWVDHLRKKDHSLQGKRLHLTKGVHIVVDQSRFPLKQAIYFDVADGRMLFAIPRDGKTYIGTTDTNYEGDLIDPKITPEDLSYLINATNEMFPSITLKEQDVEAHWVGLRPLIHEDGKSPSELSRKDEIFKSDSGLITIAGGKLTGFRKMAERVVDHVVEELAVEEKRSFPACSTDKTVLSGGEMGGPELWETFMNEKLNALKGLGIAEQQARRFIYRYGSNIDQVCQYIPAVTDLAARHNVPTIVLAELMYGLKHEMVVTAEDFLMRRTSRELFNVKEYEQYKAVVERFIEQNMNSQKQVVS